MQKPSVLVTGVAGFIGSNLADRLLRENYRVIGIDDLSYGQKEYVAPEAEFHQLDIRSKEIYPLFRGVDYVFHLAAKNDLMGCQEDPAATIDINVAGTANVFEAARRAGVKKVVFASSSAVEEGEARLNGFYAISKVADEAIAKGYRAAFGLNYVAPRYFNVYGPRQDYRRLHKPVMSSFIVNFLKGETPVLYEGYKNNKRDFIYVDDLNDFHLLCLKDDRVDNRLFKLGSGRTYSMDDVLGAIQKAAGWNVEPLVKPVRAGDTPTATLADISAVKELGWSPKTSLEEGLQKQIEFMKSEFSGGKIK